MGQTELKKTLMLPELMQLRQRININYHITPLTIDETVQYIRHRLTIAGNPDVMRFHGDIPALIYRFSGGIPRLINILCDFALLSAFTEGEKEVNADIIREVAHDLESRDYWDEPRDNTVSITVEDSKYPDLLKQVGNIALRLINLEETIKKNLPEIAVLTEKVDRLEEDISKLREQVF